VCGRRHRSGPVRPVVRASSRVQQVRSTALMYQPAPGAERVRVVGSVTSLIPGYEDNLCISNVRQWVTAPACAR